MNGADLRAETLTSPRRSDYRDMRNAIGLIALAVLVTTGCRERRYFVDVDRATWMTDPGKRAQEKVGHELDAKKRQAAEADAAAKKAQELKAADADEKAAQAIELAQRLQRELDQSREGERLRLVAGLRPALLRMALDRRVTAIELASSVAFVDPDVDLTEEAIRRVNDADKASEVARLKAENEALKAKGK